MWLQNKINKTSIFVMSRVRLNLLPCILLAALLAGCGYGFGASQQTILGNGETTLKLKSIEQPTMYPWLAQMVRSELRDEINARKAATWVDIDEAEYNLQIQINSFTMRSSISDERKESIMFNGTMSLEATLYRSHDNESVWSSGKISYSDSFETDSSQQAAKEISREIVRILVQKMRETF